jgi:hypothetical protein
MALASRWEVVIGRSAIAGKVTVTRGPIFSAATSATILPEFLLQNQKSATYRSPRSTCWQLWCCRSAQRCLKYSLVRGAGDW